ncbi:MAG TPA: phosphoribosylamine--glycine ligase, partial [Nitrospiria bacterium]|nr:phosphoribosylamine--glycine ligase [Nitrospiria bacterium]
TEGIDLTVVGPELPLSMGLVDRFQEAGLKTFGPRRMAARIETSKVFCKELLLKYDVPTARAEVAEGIDAARRLLDRRPLPLVIKAEGLAAGKGVVVAATREEADRGLDELSGLGEASRRILIEDFLSGEEMSFLVLTDGERALPLGTARDYKRVFDGDQGPNTGGMGTLSPSPLIGQDLEEVILKRIIGPTLRGLSREGEPYRGVLYAGLMLTSQGPMVLEYNARFGDPETQVILPRLQSDLLALMEQVAGGGLPSTIDWRSEASVCVVAAAKGYPGPYRKGDEIEGLDQVGQSEGLFVFHAGTYRQNEKWLTRGGRVLGVTALGNGMEKARERAYAAIRQIRFEGMHYRRDIGLTKSGQTIA